MSRFTLYFSVLILGFFLLSCAEEVDTEAQKRILEEDEVIKSFVKRKGWEAERNPAGYYFQVLEEGNDARNIAFGENVGFYYQLSLTDNSTVSRFTEEDGHPLIFRHYDNALLPGGLRLSIDQMKTNSRYRVIIPSYLGYDNYSYNGIINSRSILVFEFQTVQIYDEDYIMDLEKEMIKEFLADRSFSYLPEREEGYYIHKYRINEVGRPIQHGSRVQVQFTRKYTDGTVNMERSGSNAAIFTIGDVAANPGLQLALREMREEEEAMVLVPSWLAFQEGVQIIPLEIREDVLKRLFRRTFVRPYEPLIYDLKVIRVY